MSHAARPHAGHPQKTDIRGLLRNAWWAVKLTWSTNASLTLGLVGSSLVRSIMPAGLALTARGLIDALIRVLNGGVGQSSAILRRLYLGFGLTVLQAVSNQANKFFSERLSDELDLRITTDVLTNASSLDVSFFEDPRFQDIMERAQQNTPVHFS